MARRTTSAGRFTLFAGAVVAVMSTVAPASATSAATEATISSDLVDAARRDASLTTLRSDPRLHAIARAHAERIAGRRSIEHNPDLGRDASAAGLDWRWLGENVGVGPDARMIHDGFMHSPSHRDAMLRERAGAVGVAAVVADDGRLYVTHVYADLRRASTAAATPSRREARRPQPARASEAAAMRAPSPDPNAVTGGVVAHTPAVRSRVETSGQPASAPVTRSGLRAS